MNVSIYLYSGGKISNVYLPVQILFCSIIGSYGRKRALAYIEGDGNCLFRSISYCYYGTAVYHANVRELLVDHVADNWSTYRSSAINDHQVYSAGAYRTKMSQDGAWGGEVEIVAATKVYYRNFRIYTDVENYFTIEKQGVRQDICALYYDKSKENQEHYSVVEDK